jgi:NAD(P)H-dependent FMN reductase
LLKNIPENKLKYKERLRIKYYFSQLKSKMKKIIAICGSTRENSTNLELLKIISNLAKQHFELQIFDGIANLPHFNPDLDNPENVPPEIIAYRNSLEAADGILICTPEYAMGVPGTLKNALDWTVSSMEFSHKPTALITASTMGEKAHQSLLETLKIIETKVDEETALLISLPKTKIKNGVIVDAKTLENVNNLIRALIKNIEN